MTVSRRIPAAKSQSPTTYPQSSGSVLPAHYSPRVAGYAGGPFIEPEIVTPSDWTWRGARTYVVRGRDGMDYRCVRVSSGIDHVGYWSVELLGEPSPIDGEG